MSAPPPPPFAPLSEAAGALPFTPACSAAAQAPRLLAQAAATDQLEAFRLAGSRRPLSLALASPPRRWPHRKRLPHGQPGGGSPWEGHAECAAAICCCTRRRRRRCPPATGLGSGTPKTADAPGCQRPRPAAAELRAPTWPGHMPRLPACAGQRRRQAGKAAARRWRTAAFWRLPGDGGPRPSSAPMEQELGSLTQPDDYYLWTMWAGQ
ncbi:MAG: hypothetical protein WKG07_15440 [Hymenobacter sp.]